MTTKEKIRYAILALGVIGALVIAWIIIRGQRQHDDTLFKALVASQDREVKAVQGQRNILEQLIKEKDQMIAEHQRIDSALAIKQVQTIVKYEKIPTTVRNLSNEELRGAVTKFE